MAYSSQSHRLELHVAWTPSDIRRKGEDLSSVLRYQEAHIDSNLDGEADWPLLQVLRTEGNEDFVLTDYRYVEMFLLRSGLGTNS